MCSLVVIITSRSMAAGADKHIQDATTWFRGDTGVRLHRCRPSANTADSEAKSHGVLILYESRCLACTCPFTILL